MGAKGVNEYSADGNVYSMSGLPTYHGGFANNGIFVHNTLIPVRRISDGTSKTFLFGEAAWELGEFEAWLAGISTGFSNSMAVKNLAWPLNTYAFRVGGIASGNNINDTSFGSNHAGRGAHFSYADGSGKFFSDDVELRVLLALASRDEQEIVSEDQY